MTFSSRVPPAAAASIAILLSLQGCVSTVKGLAANLAVVNRSLPEDGAKVVVAVLPWKQGASQSPEFRAHAAQIESRLRERGFGIASATAPATHAMLVDCGIGDGCDSPPYSIPEWGITGAIKLSDSAPALRSLGLKPEHAVETQFSGTSKGDSPQSNSAEPLVPMFLNIDIVRLSAKPPLTDKRVYQARLQSYPSCGKVELIVPKLVDALFKDFPRTRAAPLPQTIALDGSCD